MSTSIQDVPHATPPAHEAPASPVTIEPTEVDVMLKADAILLIDVRSSDEHRHERIPGAVCMPLDWLDPEAIERMAAGRTIVFHCRTGRRSDEAMGRLGRELPVPVAGMRGGITAWKAEGLSVDRDPGRSLPMMRQVQIAAGAMIVAFTILAALIDPWFLLGTAFVGGGLCFAGITGTCGLAVVLGVMPWNRRTTCSTTAT
ncbi:MAG: DUF2892 domain-containing protein [Phycisphaeraceae bacterium]|nr:DUF2892 domain-containing protein [Phycisphaeraceae bacterium]